ncbi:hypothetical protein O0L34_g12049 [Tuta absoluta]|nr:hypothetical protein O0L34_g12049 [Tuta absoluta]
MFCCRYKKVLYEEPEKAPKPIGPFHETFKIMSFCLTFGMLYPNPAIEKFRFRIIFGYTLSVIPICTVFFIDIWASWVRRDIQNIVRHGTIIIPFFLVLTKTYIMYIQRTAAKQVIDEINYDHERLNTLPDSYRTVVEEHFKNAHYGERLWLTVVIHCVGVFPFTATVLTFYEYSVKSEPRKYMIHDVILPFVEPEDRFKTPYFEIVYIYMLYCCIVLFLNMAGYDGFFGLAVRHACLKLRLCCMAMDDALKRNDSDDMFEDIVNVIRDQCRVYKYVNTIQKTFNFWLGMIFLGTVVHVCNCMYQIMEGLGLDLKYLIFICGSIIHIYLPCNYASALKTMSADSATLFYSSGWERVPDQRARSMLVYMIARAQRPLVITAFNVLTFDMELFVSILHTSYSMFTILRPRD